MADDKSVQIVAELTMKGSNKWSLSKSHCHWKFLTEKWIYKYKMSPGIWFKTQYHVKRVAGPTAGQIIRDRLSPNPYKNPFQLPLTAFTLHNLMESAPCYHHHFKCTEMHLDVWRRQGCESTKVRVKEWDINKNSWCV